MEKRLKASMCMQSSKILNINGRLLLVLQEDAANNIMGVTFLTTKVGYTGTTFGVLLFFPYPPRYSQFQLFPVPSREEKRHVTLYNKAVVAIPNLSVAISYASRGAFPNEFPTIPSNF